MAPAFSRQATNEDSSSLTLRATLAAAKTDTKSTSLARQLVNRVARIDRPRTANYFQRRETKSLDERIKKAAG
ncbi:MAG: hypothetical protein ACI87E_001574, partial [Mariniblastus sp.]